jgi:hypothetical protein
MPHTALGTNHTNVAAATITLTTTAAVLAGDTIIVGSGGFNSPVRVMTITGGSLTWTNDKAAANGSDFMAVHHAIAPSGLAINTVLTCTYALGNVQGPFIAAASFPNIVSASPVDLSSSSTGTTAAWTGPSITTTQTDTVMGLAWGDSPSTSSTPTSPWVEAWDATDSGSTEEMTLVYRESVAAGTYAPAGTWLSNPGGQVLISIAYKVSAGAAAVIPPRRRLIRPRTAVPSGGRFAR